jgi:hypothetical protein
MADDVITIDSDDDDNPVPGQSNAGMTYNPAHYADLIRSTHATVAPPMRGGMGMRGGGSVPGMRMMARGRGMASRGRGGRGKPLIPKKPGAMPPFATFSKEQRSKLQEQNPDMTFADIGRTLGEMWHKLTDAEKDGYRKKAKIEEVAKLKRWTVETAPMRKQLAAQQAAALQRQQQMNAAGAAAGAGAAASAAEPGGLKRRRTHGYAIFSSEMRRELSGKYPQMQLTEAVANAWRDATAQTKAVYENRAAKLNLIEERKFRAGQTSGMSPNNRLNQQKMLARQRGVPLQHQQQQGRMVAQQQRRPIPNLPASTSLRISSVHSVQPAVPQQQSGSNKLLLPSGISISRVDSDVSVLGEQHVQQPKIHRQLPAATQLTVQRPAIAQQQLRMQQQPQRLQQARRLQQQQQFLQQHGRPRQPPPLMRGGVRGVLQRGVPMRNQMVRPVMGGQKRPAILQNQQMAAKRPRLLPQQGSPIAGGGADTLKLGLPLGPGQIGRGTARMCRMCAEPYPKVSPVYTLHDKPELLAKIDSTLAIKINLELDVKEGYPNLICRKCCHIISSFHTYKKSVDDGMVRLSQIITRKNAFNSAAASTPVPAAEDAASEAGVDPQPKIKAASSTPWIIGEDDNIGEDDDDSILPDIEIDNGDVDSGPVVKPVSITGLADDVGDQNSVDPAPKKEEGSAVEDVAKAEDESEAKVDDVVKSEEAPDNNGEDDGECDPLNAAKTLEAPGSSDEAPADSDAAAADDDYFDPLDFVQISEGQSIDNFDTALLSEGEGASHITPNGEDSNMALAEGYSEDNNGSNQFGGEDDFDSDSQTQGSGEVGDGIGVAADGTQAAGDTPEADSGNGEAGTEAVEADLEEGIGAAAEAPEADSEEGTEAPEVDSSQGEPKAAEDQPLDGAEGVEDVTNGDENDVPEDGEQLSQDVLEEVEDGPDDAVQEDSQDGQDQYEVQNTDDFASAFAEFAEEGTTNEEEGDDAVTEDDGKSGNAIDGGEEYPSNGEMMESEHSVGNGQHDEEAGVNNCVGEISNDATAAVGNGDDHDQAEADESAAAVSSILQEDHNDDNDLS